MQDVDTETIVFGGGCFWCTEAVFKMLKGVQSVEPGYAGGKVANPTYEQVSGGNTGHIEVIKVVYNPDEIAFEELLRVFFSTHDATTVDRQGNDVGPQYNSAIFYTTPRQQEKGQHYIDVINKAGHVQPIVTQVRPLEAFYPAEDYHKNYYERNKSAGYCQLVIEPKIDKVEKKFKDLLK
ncbi:peptide-methionine (S)-S-oxide reductase [Candidatus Adlerbacteria bacterium RIFOXYC1_FULL_48_26]|uniref:Peptide methionine sulfoxide reductase MsrA n=1 Tax=Candidatus Adlerbacteria bacterium RIFOXYC1_FULL_48_26 TaxID=1797247 RepID=A0A1F4Y3W3_9BACT|nr:MAG: peptide-methionine (S)-S-oxide reductase [Candidatus Adlerbacteria bacterium RIFOXYC1_FULL_48_26]OGC93844.1 MAG: peptide-methionine (S)-S-oxide reductase [Candidatus Adlerbacteria bacterium RIFOXYB1_FULL_48_10]